MARIFEILDTKEQVPERANAKPFPTRKSLGICFDNLSFSYRPPTKTLTSISFSVEPGTVLGIVGPSGSGKTTLLNLIPRFYDPSDGCIRIDGVDTRDFRLCDLRRSVAYVFQESLLIPGTVAENISYGNPAASMKDIEEAANLASAHEFISKLQNGYQTMIGEGTERLSVGEKQRLGIARAFLKNAPILLLDEPTSSLDIETESEIIRSMANLMRGRTCIVAAHRLASLARADKLITLEHGRISECGTPDELLKSGKYFSRIVQSHPQNLPSIFSLKAE
jgi:ABC-type multidrug transport system fused ATPase/permease subunit